MLYLSYMLQFVSAKIQIRVQILRAQEEISGREAGSRHLVTSLTAWPLSKLKVLRITSYSSGIALLRFCSVAKETAK